MFVVPDGNLNNFCISHKRSNAEQQNAPTLAEEKKRNILVCLDMLPLSLCSPLYVKFQFLSLDCGQLPIQKEYKA